MKPIVTYEGKIAPTFANAPWCSEEVYDRLTIVKDNNTGNSYISKIDVPAGIEITDIEYWYPFGIVGNSNSRFASNVNVSSILSIPIIIQNNNISFKNSVKDIFNNIKDLYDNGLFKNTIVKLIDNNDYINPTNIAINNDSVKINFIKNDTYYILIINSNGITTVNIKTL